MQPGNTVGYEDPRSVTTYTSPTASGGLRFVNNPAVVPPTSGSVDLAGTEPLTCRPTGSLWARPISVVGLRHCGLVLSVPPSRARNWWHFWARSASCAMTCSKNEAISSSPAFFASRTYCP